jgi:hypothetical protein
VQRKRHDIDTKQNAGETKCVFLRASASETIFENFREHRRWIPVNRSRNKNKYFFKNATQLDSRKRFRKFDGSILRSVFGFYQLDLQRTAEDQVVSS